MRDLSVGIVFTSREWRASLQRFVRDHASGVAVRVIRDQRMALEERVDVLLVDADTSFLTPGLVTALREQGVKVVAVFDPADPGADNDVARVRHLGVEETVSAATPARELLVQLRGQVPDSDLEERFGEVIAGLDMEEAEAKGRIIAAGGPPGAGATEVAIALADALSSLDSTVLVDVDEVNPGIARRLNLTLHPHLLTVIDNLRSATSPEEALAEALARPAGSSAAPPFDVVAGLANRRDWEVLHTDELGVLLDSLCAQWRYVVVNLGPHLEDLGRWVDRFLASRTAMSDADLVIGVCEASPRGLLRFFDWLVEVESLSGGAPVNVVLNRAPRSKFRRGEVVDQLYAHAGPRVASVSVAPEDKRVPRAEWDGALVSHGPFRRAIGAAAGLVAPQPRRRRPALWSRR